MSSKKTGIIPPVLFMLFGILLIVYLIPSQVQVIGNGNPINAQTVPYLMAGIIILFSSINCYVEIKKVIQDRNSNKIKQSDENENTKQNSWYVGVFLAVILLAIWVILTPYLGFVVTNMMIVACFVVLCGSRNLFQIILLPVLFTMIALYLFQSVLRINLPSGLFF